MSSYYLVPERRQGRTDRLRQPREVDLIPARDLRQSSRAYDSRYNDGDTDRSGALVLVDPNHRQARMSLNRNEGLLVRPAHTRRRSRSRPRFRDDDSIIDDDSQDVLREDGSTYIRSRARPGQRPTHALVRSKSRRRRHSSGNKYDLESKSSRSNRDFQRRRADLEIEEAVVLVRARSRDRGRYGIDDSINDHDHDRRYVSDRRLPDTRYRREGRSRRDYNFDDDNDEPEIVVLPNNSRSRDTLDGRSQGRTRSRDRETDGYIAQGQAYIRSEENYSSRRRSLVDRLRDLTT